MIEAAKNLVKHGAIRWFLWKEQRDRVARGGSQNMLAPELWGCGQDAADSLTIDGVSVRALREEYGTPLHVINERQLLDTFDQFKRGFESVYPNIVLGTSYKTNPLPYVLNALHEAGSYAEVISHFELWLAQSLGIPSDRIILNGPGKGDDALRLAVGSSVRIINIDGPGEIPKIANFARSLGVRQAVGLRVISSVGWSSQFGLSIETGAAEEAFRKMQEFPELVPEGLHLHLGTGIGNIETYVRAVQELVDFGEHLRAKLGINMNYYDLGGGFGVPTVRGKTDWDLRMASLGYPPRLAEPDTFPRPADYARALRPALEQILAKMAPGDSPPTVVLEPGRAITSNSQTLLLTVIARKPGVSGKDYLIVDGGKNITLPLEWESHRIFPATRMSGTDSFKFDVFGPLCHPGDILVKNQLLPDLGEGDILAIMDAGAYFIPNQMNFSNPRPAVVCVRNGEHFVVRERESFDDIIRADRLYD